MEQSVGEVEIHGCWGNSSRRGLGGLISPQGEWGAHREVCVCACVCEGLRGPSPGQRCLAAWALQGAPETGNLYMEPPSVQTLHSQLHTVYCKSPQHSSIAILTLKHTDNNSNIHGSTFIFTNRHAPYQLAKNQGLGI